MAKVKKTKVRRHDELRKIKGAIRERGLTYREVAQEMGIGVTSLSDKINGFYPFTVTEMQQLAILLDIAPADIVYFFMPGYCKTQHNRAM